MVDDNQKVAEHHIKANAREIRETPRRMTSASPKMKKMSKNEAIRNWKSSLPERKPAGRMLFAVLAREDSIAEVRSSRSAEVVVVGAIFFFNSAWFAGRCRNHGDVG
jgi:hypothetical protein